MITFWLAMILLLVAGIIFPGFWLLAIVLVIVKLAKMI